MAKFLKWNQPDTFGNFAMMWCKILSSCALVPTITTPPPRRKAIRNSSKKAIIIMISSRDCGISICTTYLTIQQLCIYNVCTVWYINTTYCWQSISWQINKKIHFRPMFYYDLWISYWPHFEFSKKLCWIQL